MEKSIKTENDYLILNNIFQKGGLRNPVRCSYNEFHMNPKTFFIRIKMMEKRGQILVIRNIGFNNLYKITQVGIVDMSAY